MLKETSSYPKYSSKICDIVFSVMVLYPILMKKSCPCWKDISLWWYLQGLNWYRNFYTSIVPFLDHPYCVKFNFWEELINSIHALDINHGMVEEHWISVRNLFNSQTNNWSGWCMGGEYFSKGSTEDCQIFWQHIVGIFWQQRLYKSSNWNSFYLASACIFFLIIHLYVKK